MDRADSDNTPFSPPSAAEVEAYLDKHPPRGPSKSTAWLKIALLAGSLVISYWASSPLAAALPWAVMGVILVDLLSAARRKRLAERHLAQAQEDAAIHRWLAALRCAWELVPAPAVTPTMHGRAVLLIAHCLDQLNRHDAAIVAYRYLIDRIPPGDPLAVQLKIQYAMAQLAGDQLTDADDTLRRLLGNTDALKQPHLRAAYKLATLYQQAGTNHWADAVTQDADSLINELRPLGIEAGFGYALLALCHYQQRQHSPHTPDGTPHDHQDAAWWARATLLLPVRKLVARLPQLKQLSLHLQAQQPPPALTSAC